VGGGGRPCLQLSPAPLAPPPDSQITPRASVEVAIGDEGGGRRASRCSEGHGPRSTAAHGEGSARAAMAVTGPLTVPSLGSLFIASLPSSSARARTDARRALLDITSPPVAARPCERRRMSRNRAASHLLAKFPRGHGILGAGTGGETSGRARCVGGIAVRWALLDAPVAHPRGRGGRGGGPLEGNPPAP